MSQREREKRLLFTVNGFNLVGTHQLTFNITCEITVDLVCKVCQITHNLKLPIYGTNIHQTMLISI